MMSHLKGVRGPPNTLILQKEEMESWGDQAICPVIVKIIKQVARLMMAIADCSPTWYNVSIGRVSPAC